MLCRCRGLELAGQVDSQHAAGRVYPRKRRPKEQGAQGDRVLSHHRTTPRSSCALSWLLSPTLMRTGTFARTS